VGAKFSAPVQTGPGALSASCTKGKGSFPGVKRPGRGVDHPYLYSLSGPSWPILGWTLLYVLYVHLSVFMSLAITRQTTDPTKHFKTCCLWRIIINTSVSRTTWTQLPVELARVEKQCVVVLYYVYNTEWKVRNVKFKKFQTCELWRTVDTRRKYRLQWGLYWYWYWAK
jgi:hypothetical protein